MPEASDKQPIKLHRLTAESAYRPDNILDLLEEIGRASSAHEIGAHPHLNGSDISDHLESPQYPRNSPRRYCGQILVYSCASPAVLTILQTLSDLFS